VFHDFLRNRHVLLSIDNPAAGFAFLNLLSRGITIYIGMHQIYPNNFRPVTKAELDIALRHNRVPNAVKTLLAGEVVEGESSCDCSATSS